MFRLFEVFGFPAKRKSWVFSISLFAKTRIEGFRVDCFFPRRKVGELRFLWSLSNVLQVLWCSDLFSLQVCSFLGQKDKDCKFRGFMQRDTLPSSRSSSFFLSKAKGEEESFVL